MANKIYKSSSTFTAPAGVTNVRVISRQRPRPLSQSSGSTLGGTPMFIDGEGRLFAWGKGGAGQVGNGGTANMPAPVHIATSLLFKQCGGTWRHVDNTNYGSRNWAISSNGTIYTWGSGNASYPLGGTNGTANRNQPTVMNGLVPPILKMYANGGSWFAIDGQGNYWSWGEQNASNPALGLNDSAIKNDPVKGSSASQRFVKIYTGNGTTFFQTEQGTVLSCGAGTVGQLGNGSNLNVSYPVTIGSQKWQDLQECGGAWLGLDMDGYLYSWGSGSFLMNGQDQSSVHRNTPTLFADDLGKFKQIFSSNMKFYALHESGLLFCWGPGSAWGYPDPPIGDETGAGAWYPTLVVNQGGAGWEKFFITNSGSVDFALDKNGDLWSWGYNSKGEMGIGNTAGDGLPTKVIGGHKFVDLQIYRGQFTDGTGVLAADENGRLFTWGSNDVFGGVPGATHTPTILKVGFLDEFRVDTTVRTTEMVVPVVPGQTYEIDLFPQYASFGNKSIGRFVDEVEVIYTR